MPYFIRQRPAGIGQNDLPFMPIKLPLYLLLLLLPAVVSAGTSKLPGIGAKMQLAVDAHELSGAVTVIATREKVIHCEATGLGNIATKEPMRTDSLFWIASMTKPVTGVALLMLQDEGKLNVADPVTKYIAEFAALKTPSGKPANLTITQIMTHTSGLGEASKEASASAQTLADLIPAYLNAPMQYEPGTQWRYTQSGINVGARIVEVTSGISFDAFLQKRLFDPLGMKDTTFYPTRKPSAHVAVGYKKTRRRASLSRRLSLAALEWKVIHRSAMAVSFRPGRIMRAFARCFWGAVRLAANDTSARKR